MRLDAFVRRAADSSPADSSDGSDDLASIGAAVLLLWLDAQNDGEVLHRAAARRDLAEITRLIDEEGASVNAADSLGQRPLHVCLTGWGEEPSDDSVAADPATAALEVLRLLLARGAEVDAVDMTGEQPIHCAAGEGNLEAAELLCAHGASVTATDEDGEQPLRIVCALGHLAFARFLLAKGAVVGATNDSGEQPIHRAAEAGHVEVVQWLLDQGAEAEARCVQGKTPLMLACFEGQAAVTTLLMGVNASVHACSANGESVMHYAARNGSLECAKLLRAAGAAIDKRDEDGDTPLSSACGAGSLEVASWLRKEGAKVKGVSNKLGESPLHLASEDGSSLELVGWLVDVGCGVNQRVKSTGFTPVLCACAAADPALEVVRLLHVRGAKLKGREAAAKDGEQPIHKACRTSDSELLCWLLAQGVGIDTPAAVYPYRQPIHFVVESDESVEMMTALLEVAERSQQLPIVLEACDKEGDRASHLAAQAADLPLLELLHGRGADLEAANRKNVRPMHRACACDAVDVVKALHEQFGCTLEGAPAKMGSDSKRGGGFLPVHAAAESYGLRTLQYLHAKGCRLDVRTAEGKEGLTPLELIEGSSSRLGVGTKPMPRPARRAANWVRFVLGLEPRWDESPEGDDSSSEEDASASG